MLDLPALRVLGASVELPGSGGDRRSENQGGDSRFETAKQFAKRGIVGLKSDKTVARYVKAASAP